MKKILFLTTHPKEVASTRFRVLAYFDALREAGFETEIHPFFPSEALEAIYDPRAWHRKLGLFLTGSLSRWRRLRGSSPDLLFIHRELFPWGMSAGMALMLPFLRASRLRVVFDFDDAIYLPHRQDRRWLGRLENPGSVEALLALSHCVFAGNRHLAGFASRFNRNVSILPTPVDTDRFSPDPTLREEPVPILSWIGSPSTAKYLQGIVPALEELSRRRRFRLKVIGAGEGVEVRGVEVDNRPWRLEGEAEEFRRCSIGLYPLWDDEWSRGKCGFKALQFMASGVPVVASPVGINTEIVLPGENGLFARTPEEWVEALARLLEEPALGRRLGAAGRRTVEERYSLRHLAPRWIGLLEEILDPSLGRASAASPGREDSAAKPQDILCFSSIDWDFVWQGHQEIMSTLAAQGHRVLFVENTGVRNPRLQDLPRIRHRFSQWHRSLAGFRQEREGLYLFSPLILPFPYSPLAARINRWLLTGALKRWMEAMDFDRPVCWTFIPTPTTLEVLDRIPKKALIYYCIDSFPDSTPAARRIVPSEEALFRKADLVFVTSRVLLERAARFNRNVHWFPFGVNLSRFEEEREGPSETPPDLREIPKPIVGYLGGIHQWVDQDLLSQVAQGMPDHSFVLVGPLQTEAQRLKRHPNLHFLGQKSHQE
ncbi:MAG: glycosyltransferase, partial [Candidatus Omnitrophica bacterium]|nr:glycosyltransferase [Candidatus Omnitrophota bacterium]